MSERYCIPLNCIEVLIVEYASPRADSTLVPVAITFRTLPPAVTSSPAVFLEVPAWSLDTFLFDGRRIVILSPIDWAVGYPFDASTTTTDADCLVLGMVALLESSAIA